MEIIIIVAGLVLGLIVVLGRMQHLQNIAKTNEQHKKAIVELEKAEAKAAEARIESADLPDVIDSFNGMFAPNQNEDR